MQCCVLFESFLKKFHVAGSCAPTLIREKSWKQINPDLSPGEGEIIRYLLLLIFNKKYPASAVGRW
jgi:hypothetical protein